jgi:protein-S-isoprenylcysteine O-methyltransferase Ste14
MGDLIAEWRSYSMNEKRILPPTYLLISLLTMVALHFLLPQPKAVLTPWNLVGVIPLLAGIALNLLADTAFRAAKTTVKPFIESVALVTSGVFGISRHPMYLGYVLILAGVALVLQSVSTYIVIPVFIVLMEIVFIRVEERMLLAKFGEAYRNYQKSVRRWL